MKQILSILGLITLIGTSTTSLVACDMPQEYTKEELAKLKEENKINTANQEIRDNLEWIAPQEKPFNKVDDKWYFIIWKADKWIITKYKNNRYEPDKGWIIKELKNNENRYRLMIRPKTDFGAFSDGYWTRWNEDNGTYFKSVYRWNLDTTEPNLDIDENGNVKIND